MIYYIVILISRFRIIIGILNKLSLILLIYKFQKGNAIGFEFEIDNIINGGIVNTIFASLYKIVTFNNFE